MITGETFSWRVKDTKIKANVFPDGMMRRAMSLDDQSVRHIVLEIATHGRVDPRAVGHFKFLESL